jgi:hypothetical protein
VRKSRTKVHDAEFGGAELETTGVGGGGVEGAGSGLPADGRPTESDRAQTAAT